MLRLIVDFGAHHALCVKVYVSRMLRNGRLEHDVHGWGQKRTDDPVLVNNRSHAHPFPDPIYLRVHA